MAVNESRFPRPLLDLHPPSFRQLLNSKPPIAPTHLNDDWYASTKEAIRNWDGVPIRANPTQPAIDVWSINFSQWLPLMLPGGGVTFENFDQRNVVLRRLQGR